MDNKKVNQVDESILFDDMTVLADVKNAQKQSAEMEETRFDPSDYALAPLDAQGNIQNQRERDVLTVTSLTNNSSSASAIELDEKEAYSSISAEMYGNENNVLSTTGESLLSSSLLSYERVEVKEDVLQKIEELDIETSNADAQNTKLNDAEVSDSEPIFSASKIEPINPVNVPLTQNVTEAPTEPVTEAPTGTPTEAPTEAPTGTPTEAPTEPVTEAPTEAPTEPVTDAPTEPVTEAPTEYYVSSEKVYVDTQDITKTVFTTSFVDVTVEHPVIEVTTHNREVLVEKTPEKILTRIEQETYTETELVDVTVQKTITEEKTVIDLESMEYDFYDEDLSKYFKTETHTEIENQPREETITEYRTETVTYTETQQIIVDVNVEKTRTVESVDVSALLALGITLSSDGNYYQIDETKPKVQTTVVKYKEVTTIEEAAPIFKTATESTVVPTLGDEYSSGSISISKKSSKTVMFEDTTKNIEIDYTSFDTGTVKISFIDASGNQVGATLNQSHINDSRGYAVPDGAAGVKIENLSTTTPVTIGEILYRGPTQQTVVEVGGLVPDTEAMESQGITWQDVNAIHLEQTTDITNIGNVGDSNVKGFNPEDSEKSTVFSFGSDLANQMVSITLDYTVKGTWDFNSISTKDIFTVSANGSPIVTYNYTDNQTDFNNAVSSGLSVEKVSSSGTSFVQSYEVYLDEQGNVQLDFMVASTADGEIVNITNTAVDYNGYTGYIKETTNIVPYEETVFVDAVAELVPYDDLPKTYTQETYIEVEQRTETIEVEKTREVEVPYDVTVTTYEQVEVLVTETVEVEPLYATITEERVIDVVEQQEVVVVKTRDVEVTEVIPAVFETITETYTTEETVMVSETTQQEVITETEEIDQSIVQNLGILSDKNGWYYEIDTLHVNEPFAVSGNLLVTETGTEIGFSGIEVVTNGIDDLFLFGNSSIQSSDWISSLDPSENIPIDISSVNVDVLYAHHEAFEITDTTSLSW